MTQDNKKNALTKKARRKYLANGIKHKLSEIKDSELIDSYRKSFMCSHTIFQVGTKLTSLYCNQRWCPTCTAIKTAKFIDAYKHELEGHKDFYFVTLTVKSDAIGIDELDPAIKAMIGTWKKINDYCKKQKQRGKLEIWHGIRKVECTYREDLTFHPHFHLLVRTKEAADLIKAQWLIHNPTCIDKLQTVLKATEGIEKEMFKYYTKLLSSSSKKGQQKNRSIDPVALDKVLIAMRKKRVFHNFGTFKKKIDDTEDPELISQSFDIEEDTASFKWRKNDWLNQETGELLTGYVPNEAFKKLIYSEGKKSSERKQFLDNS